MAAATVVRRRLTTFLAMILAALMGTAFLATPAHATFGSPLTVDLQLRGSFNGTETLVGRLVGTLQFDDGNATYTTSLVMCRQSSYTNPNVRISVNGTQQLWLSPSDNTPRPGSCGGGHGMSGVIVGPFTYSGTIYNITLTIEGIFFNGSTATTKTRSAFYDNPFD